MKKIIVCVLVAILSLLTFAGCGESQSDNKSAGADSVKTTLTLHKKYIKASDVSEPEGEQRYYVFTDESTGSYHYYYSYFSEFLDTTEIQDYTVRFRYYIVEDTLNCFFDSVEFGDKHNTGEDVLKKSWTVTFMPTESFLLMTNGTYYLNEDFLKNELVNFGK